MQIGDKIKIADLQSESLKQLSDQIANTQSLINFSSKVLRRSNDDLFVAIRQIYPELEDFELTYNLVKQEILILFKKDKNNE